MFWICMFALIMEIVFRAQNNAQSSSGPKLEKYLNTTLNQDSPSEYEVVNAQTPIISTSNSPQLPQDLPTEVVEFQVASDLLATEGILYLVQNAQDGSLLTASATRSSPCVYQLSSITSTRSLSKTDQANHHWFYKDDSQLELATQLWEVVKEGKTLFLQPGAIDSRDKWSFRVVNVSSISGSEEPQAKDNLADMETKADPETDFAMADKMIVMRPGTSSKMRRYFPRYENNKANDDDEGKYYRSRHERKQEQWEHYHRWERKSPVTTDEGPNSLRRRKRRSLENRGWSSGSGSGGQRGEDGEGGEEYCDLSSWRIVWKSQWEVVNMDGSGERFQIRDIRGKCVESGGFIGICPQWRLGSDSNSSWYFQPVADLITMH